SVQVGRFNMLQPGSVILPVLSIAPTNPARTLATFLNPIWLIRSHARADRPPVLQPTTSFASLGSVASTTATKSGLGDIPAPGTKFINGMFIARAGCPASNSGTDRTSR